MEQPLAATGAASPSLPTLERDTVVAGRYQIEALIAGSSYSHVYRAVDLKKDKEKRGTVCCVKIERTSDTQRHSLLKSECNALRSLRDTRLVPRVLAYCAFEKSVQGALLILDLMGEDLRRHVKRNGGLSGQATAFVGLQMLKVLQRLHERGFIHSDVKPGNFVLGRRRDDRFKVYAIDFGLARRHLDSNGKPRPAREGCTFRGTTMYASENAHACRDLCRADDLWSLLYTLMEFAGGPLPWSSYLHGTDKLSREEKKRSKKKVQGLKHLLTSAAMSCSREDLDERARVHLRSLSKYLEKRVPKPLVEMLRLLTTWDYYAEPDYMAIRSLLSRFGSPDELMAAARKELGGGEAVKRPSMSDESNKRKLTPGSPLASPQAGLPQVPPASTELRPQPFTPPLPPAARSTSTVGEAHPVALVLTEAEVAEAEAAEATADHLIPSTPQQLAASEMFADEVTEEDSQGLGRLVPCLDSPMASPMPAAECLGTADPPDDEDELSFVDLSCNSGDEQGLVPEHDHWSCSEADVSSGRPQPKWRPRPKAPDAGSGEAERAPSAEAEQQSQQVGSQDTCREVEAQATWPQARQAYKKDVHRDADGCQAAEAPQCSSHSVGELHAEHFKQERADVSQLAQSAQQRIDRLRMKEEFDKKHAQARARVRTRKMREETDEHLKRQRLSASGEGADWKSWHSNAWWRCDDAGAGK